MNLKVLTISASVLMPGAIHAMNNNQLQHSNASIIVVQLYVYNKHRQLTETSTFCFGSDKDETRNAVPIVEGASALISFDKTLKRIEFQRIFNQSIEDVFGKWINLSLTAGSSRIIALPHGRCLNIVTSISEK